MVGFAVWIVDALGLFSQVNTNLQLIVIAAVAKEKVRIKTFPVFGKHKTSRFGSPLMVLVPSSRTVRRRLGRCHLVVWRSFPFRMLVYGCAP
jgi:hypothetical protein